MASEHEVKGYAAAVHTLCGRLLKRRRRKRISVEEVCAVCDWRGLVVFDGVGGRGREVWLVVRLGMEI